MTQNTLLIGVSYSDCKKKSLQRALNLFNASAKICQIANFVTQSQQVIQSFIQLFNHFKTKDLNLEKLKIWKNLISNIELLI